MSEVLSVDNVEDALADISAAIVKLLNGFEEGAALRVTRIDLRRCPKGLLACCTEATISGSAYSMPSQIDS